MTIDFHSPFPMLSCNDLAASLRFYRDLLGFQVTYQFPPPGDAAEEFVALELEGGGSLGLASKTNPPIHGRAFGPLGGHFFELCIYTADVDRAVEHLREEGVRTLVEPREQPWGERIAYVTDPDDNPIMIASQSSD